MVLTTSDTQRWWATTQNRNLFMHPVSPTRLEEFSYKKLYKEALMLFSGKIGTRNDTANLEMELIPWMVTSTDGQLHSFLAPVITECALFWASVLLAAKLLPHHDQVRSNRLLLFGLQVKKTLFLILSHSSFCRSWLCLLEPKTCVKLTGSCNRWPAQ